MKKIKYLVIALALVLSFSLVTPVPALAAPVVASVTETAFGTDTTDHYVDMPATVNAGDLLIVLFTNNDGSATVTTPGGWNALASTANGSAVRLSIYYKIAAGTEGGTTVNFATSANEQATAQVYRITDWHGTTPPEISTAATNTNTRPDPASLDPAGWDVADTLWIAVAGQDRGDQSGTTAYPSSYTDGISTQSSDPATTGVCRVHSARRVLAVASENPGAFTIPTSEEWVAFTIAVRPAPRDLTVSSTEGGSVTTPGEGVFTYDEGTVVDLVAEAEEGYRFVEWAGDVSTIDDVYSAETTITMNGDYAITAEFVKQYDLTISSTAGGSVIEPGEDTFTYDEGMVIDLMAQAEEGYRFDKWTGDVGTIVDIYSAETTITMNGDYAITAEFVKQYDLTISSTEGGSVTEPGEGVFTYDEGTIVDLVAEVEEGYRFVEWTGDVGTIADIYSAETTITMNGNYAITAEFVKQYDLTISSTEGGSVTEPGEGVFTYDEGTIVDLVAEAEEGYRFVRWTGDVGTIADIYDASTTITMNGNYSITANFEEIPPSPVYPTVTTQAATNITTNSATLNMNYTVGDFSPVQVRFAYKKSAGLFWSYTDWVSKSGDGTHAAPLTGLDSNTEYEFTAQLKYNDTVIEGTTLQFTTDTSSVPPPTGGCFIATAAYGTPTAEQIDVLREFRDVVLLESTVGSQFVALYYRFSPPVADFIAENELLRTLVRELLVDPIVWVVEATGDTWRN
jgi:preprotein translocase subunit YajC